MVNVNSIANKVEGLILIIVFFIVLGSLASPLITAVNDTQTAFESTGYGAIFGVVLVLIIFGIITWVLRTTMPKSK